MSTPGHTNDPAAETIRQRVEHALTVEQVDLTSHAGRERTLAIIDREISDYHAQALNNGGGQLSEHDRATLARTLQDDLVGLGAIAERMLSDESAQEWMVNTPTRVFRDSGIASNWYTTCASKTTGRSARSSNAEGFGDACLPSACVRTARLGTSSPKPHDAGPRCDASAGLVAPHQTVWFHHTCAGWVRFGYVSPLEVTRRALGDVV
jgi:hypothetical protein